LYSFVGHFYRPVEFCNLPVSLAGRRRPALDLSRGEYLVVKLLNQRVAIGKRDLFESWIKCMLSLAVMSVRRKRAQKKREAEGGRSEELRLKSTTITLAHVGSGRVQECSATAQAAYSWLTLHPCVTQGQIRKKFCVRVDFTP
jgi:hypothetical protein